MILRVASFAVQLVLGLALAALVIGAILVAGLFALQAYFPA